MSPPAHPDAGQMGIIAEDETRLHYFNAIINTADEVENLLKESFSLHQSSPLRLPPPITISLPVPCPITPKLIQTGLDNNKIESLSTLFMQKAHALRETLETSIRQGCADLAKVPGNSTSRIMDLQTHLNKSMSDAYSRQLEKWATDLVQGGLETASKLRREQRGENNQSNLYAPKSKTAFNHVSPPLASN